jgi:hypothetical protein
MDWIPGPGPGSGLTCGIAVCGIAVCGIAGFGALTAGLRRREVEAGDHAIAARLQATGDPALDQVMRFVSWFGFPPQGRLLPPAWQNRADGALVLASWTPGASLVSLRRGARPPRAAGRPGG